MYDMTRELKAWFPTREQISSYHRAMTSVLDLAKAHTRLTADQAAHLQRLVMSWAILADFSFADLLLMAPSSSAEAGHLVVLAQVRPSTGQTCYLDDWVGVHLSSVERPAAAECMASGVEVTQSIDIAGLDRPAAERCIPVRCEGETIAVLARTTSPAASRSPGELEKTYLQIFDRFAGLIAAGRFPYQHSDPHPAARMPRVGDGVIVLDAQRAVTYASPNAVSALHRLGVRLNARGQRLNALGVDDAAVRTAWSTDTPVLAELEHGDDVTVLMHCLPVSDNGIVTAAVILVRDISEVKRRDRVILSKDATIAEIHHRVKNNLQTISSLLRLQSRRLTSGEAKMAIEDSVRRIRSIALVHEAMLREPDDDVSMATIVRSLCKMIEESLDAPDRPVRIVVAGEGGALPADRASAFAVVLNELVQNAVEHGFPTGAARVEVLLGINEGSSLIQVTDRGAGLPAGFDLDTSAGLGLSIVRTLVRSELAGTIDLTTNEPGVIARLVVPSK